MLVYPSFASLNLLATLILVKCRTKIVEREKKSNAFPERLLKVHTEPKIM
jgi:hypothetical protein